MNATIRFNNKDRSFYLTVRKRVDEYFKTRNISRYGNFTMVFKTIFMFALYLTPYILLITNVFHNNWILAGLCVLMGIGMSGIGLSVMHDACHSSYSKHAWVNNLLAHSMHVIGGSPLNWQLQHNNLHHTFTNIEGHDEDIAPLGFLRFCPHAPYKKMHRFQFLYAWFFYGMMTLMWSTTKDFSQLKRYNSMGMLAGHHTTYRKELIKLTFFKVLYLVFTLVLPLIFVDMHWWQIVIGYLIMHFTCGLSLALIFQPAHVVEMTDFPLPSESGNMEDDWAAHQLRTTANFAQRSWLFSWFVGGLNFQVEHHLFPNICHVHYKKIAPIIRQTAEEFNLPYYSKKTFVGAVASHARMLYQLGKGPAAA
ncbi:MAG: acyl-CoA desaturase [Bacteroidetes bacterium]|nr:acyl-CoA desaturase [Bacteroidota bacterium]